MSVYIPGMEMPTEGNETIIRIQPDGTVLDQYGHHLAISAIPVPEHMGRLISAFDTVKAFCHRGLYVSAEIVSDMPTIIPPDPIKEVTE